MLASASGSGDIGGKDNSIRLWDVGTGTHKHTLTGHTGWVVSVAFQSGWADARNWELGQHYPAVGCRTGTYKDTLTRHTIGSYSVAFSPDGQNRSQVGVWV